MITAEEVLKTRKVYALLGASQDSFKYSSEVFHTLLEAGYTVYPINPRYETIDDHPCYASLADLPEVPEVVITTLAPANTEKALEQIAAQGVKLVWIPPGSWSNEVLDKCKQLGLEVLYDVCPVGTLKVMQP
ncbi:MAG: CoA-binding protein [candidate division KSB1 bacterium]|nr:CoA-binding protein [candidate division KSB1 bacterium]